MIQHWSRFSLALICEARATFILSPSQVSHASMSSSSSRRTSSSAQKDGDFRWGSSSSPTDHQCRHQSSMSAEFTEIIVISCHRTETPTSPDLRNRPSEKVCLVIKKRKAELLWTLFSFLILTILCKSCFEWISSITVLFQWVLTAPGLFNRLKSGLLKV